MTRICSALRRPMAMKRSKRVDELAENFVNSTEHLSDHYIPLFIDLRNFLIAIEESHDVLHSSEATAVLIRTTQASLQRQFKLLRSSVESRATECSIEISKSQGSDCVSGLLT